MLPPLLSLRGLPPPVRDSYFCSLLTHAHEVQFAPLTPHFLCSSLRFCTVGIPSSWLTVGAAFSKPFAKYLLVLVMWSCRGTLRLVTSAPHLCFPFGKASVAVTLVGRLKCLEVLSPPSFFPYLLGLRPVAQLQLDPLPLFPPPQLASYGPLSAVDLRSLYNNPPWLYPSSWLSLMPCWHTHRGPLNRVCTTHFPSCHRVSLRSLAPLQCAGPYIHFLAEADTRHLLDVIFLCQGFIHFLCSPLWFS